MVYGCVMLLCAMHTFTLALFTASFASNPAD